MNQPIVFLGPSLAKSEAELLLDADYRPPVQQGDVMRALADNPVAIAIIDGVFTDVPTVRHREILWAMSQGVTVFGGASMGALRAAELAEHGMIGIGLIYRWYRRYALLPDDAVAVAHAPTELGSLPLSLSLVDIRRSLRAAERAGVLPPDRAQALAEAATAIQFGERRLDTLPATKPEQTAIQSHLIGQKADDARAVLRRLAHHVTADDWPTHSVKKPAIVNAWLDDLTSGGFDVNQVL